jgi:hypothetical protein
MSYAYPSDLCRLRKLAGDIMFNLGVVCDQIDELAAAATDQDADRHNEAMVSIQEALITIPYNCDAMKTALPKEIEA